jgi:hypothetical protein
VDDGADQQAASVGQDVALTSLDFLAGVVSAGPPASVVLTDWLSITLPMGWLHGLGSLGPASTARG